MELSFWAVTEAFLSLSCEYVRNVDDVKQEASERQKKRSKWNECQYNYGTVLMITVSCKKISGMCLFVVDVKKEKMKR